MCWSSEASLSFFIVGTILSLWLVQRNGLYDRLFGFFFLWVITMQILEYLMWIDQECETNLNNNACQIAWFQNLMQPVVCALLIMRYSYNQAIFSLPIFIILYLLWVLIWIFREKPYKDKMCAKPCENCEHNLQWPWIKNYDKSIWIGYYILLTITIISTVKNKGSQILGLYLLITCIIAASLMPVTKLVASWWCVFAVGGPILKAIIPLTYFKK